MVRSSRYEVIPDCPDCGVIYCACENLGARPDPLSEMAREDARIAPEFLRDIDPETFVLWAAES